MPDQEPKFKLGDKVHGYSRSTPAVYYRGEVKRCVWDESFGEWCYVVESEKFTIPESKTERTE